MHNHPHTLVITLRKLVIKDPSYQNIKIRLGVSNGLETLWCNHQKNIRNNMVKFFGESFCFGTVPQKLQYLINIKNYKSSTQNALKVKVSNSQIESFSKKKNTYYSQSQFFAIAWQSQITSQNQQDLSGTLSGNQRFIEDFSDMELLSPTKIQNRKKIYSPCYNKKHRKQSISLQKRSDSFSQKNSHSGKNKKFTLNTNDTFLVSKKSLVPQIKKKISKNHSLTQNKATQKKIEIQIKQELNPMRESKILRRAPTTPKVNRHQFNYINERMNTKSAILAGVFGAVSGLSGAIISFV